MKDKLVLQAKPGRNPARNRSVNLFVTFGFILVGAMTVLIPLFGACQAGITTVPPTSSQDTMSSTGSALTTSTSNSPSAITTGTSSSNTDISPSVTSTIDTGTGETFTISWEPPSPTVPPYLTFYNDVKYTLRHLWVRLDSPGIVTVGFTDYGQLMFGRIWSINIASAGTVITQDTDFGFVQGEDTMDYNLIAPVGGTILEVNQDVLNDYDLINQSPYDLGWLVRIQMSNPAEFDGLLTAAQYAGECCPPCHCDN